MLLTPITTSPYFYPVLYIAVSLLLAFNVLEIVFLLIHRRSWERSEERKELLKREISATVITVDEPAAVLPKPLTGKDYAAYCEVASRIIESFEGEVAERAKQLIYKFGVDAYYKRRSFNMLWFKRAHAVDMLSSLKLENNRGFFLEGLERESSAAVKYRMFYGLSLIARNKEDAYRLALLLTGLPYLTAKYNEDLFFNVITALRHSGKDEEFGLFLQQVMTDTAIRTKEKRDCLSACQAALYKQAAPIALEYYKEFTKDSSIIIACVRILAHMKDFSILPEALHSKDWRVKLAAIKYAHLCGSDVLPTLKSLLHDPAYHIRLNAALALSRAGNKGLEVLQSEKVSSDKFAADVAGYALDAMRTA